MNQILSTGNKPNKNKPNLDIKKIIIIFSSLIILFALVIVGSKVYNMIKEILDENNQISLLNKPEISIEKTENICTLTVSYDEGLDKVTYSWNNQDVIEKNMNGTTTPFITQIIIPEGDYNLLYVEAVGVDGSVNEIEQEFYLEEMAEPEISWFYNEETRKIEIVARSNKGIANLTYQWENEELVVVDNEEEVDKEIEAIIDVKRGTNKISITATDLDGNIAVKEDLIQGIFAPNFRVQLVNNETLVINVSHDKGFKKVTINVNGQELVYDENHEQYSTEMKNLSTSIGVEPGTVTVKISVYTLEEEEKEYTYEASTQISE